MGDHDRSAADLLDLAYPYALDSIDETERVRIQRRLEEVDDATAAEFAAAVYDLREVLASLSVLDELAPPPELEHSLLRAVDESLRAHRRDNGHRPWYGRLGWLAAAAAVIIAIGAGVAVVTQRSEPEAPGGISAELVLTQPDLRIREVPVSSGGSLTVQTSAGISAAIVDFDDVPAPPDGRAYQVWLVPPQGSPRSVAVVAVPSVLTRFDPVDTLAVTVEPAGGSPQPTTTPIAALPLA